MNWNHWVRQSHRWVSLVFTLTVAANFAAMALGDGVPPPWVTYSPLLPLAWLLVSGLYLWVLPYVGGKGRRGNGQEQAVPKGERSGSTAGG